MAKLGRPKATDEAIDTLGLLISAEKQRAVDARLETMLGRMLRHRQIESLEYLAGEAFGLLVANLRRLKGYPRGLPKPNQFEPRIPGSSEFDYDPEYVQEVEDEYDAIYAAVMALHGLKGLMVVYDLCVDGCYIEIWRRDLLKAALKTVAQKIRLKNKLRTGA